MEVKEWKFVEDLQKPIHQQIIWTRRGNNPKKNEANLGKGVCVKAKFHDPDGVLETAYNDFNKFLEAGNIKKNNSYEIITGYVKTDKPETYHIVVDKKQCRILAGDTEGIRRGIIFIEDEMLRAEAPFLPLGAIKRKPLIHTRISRCYFSPINRPPKNTDELADNIDYYPNEYLNRLAHDGVNAVWITIRFSETCPSKIIPEYGKDSARRLEKLRLTVEKCARYGIKVYVFCIEPRAFSMSQNPEYADKAILEKHPELAGRSREDIVYFCTSAPKARAYLEEATYNLFLVVPGLAGIIDISVGERPTHCYSTHVIEGSLKNNCQRCSKRKPWEVLYDTLLAMEKGMKQANPDAKLISWPYSQYLEWGEKLTRESAAHIPEGVILQHNFESAGYAKQLGKMRRADDYWLSYIGPSRLFKDTAKIAVKSGREVSAKLQVGCSHEVATVPFVPVPGNLYKKYKSMHKLGVSSVMMSWYFGSFPSVMTRASAELSFSQFPKTEDDFLIKLAKRDWGENAKNVAKAWKLFAKGYNNYPINYIFGYYGPMHDGPVWQMYLKPVDKVLAPTWKLDYPIGGDRIGECITYSHTMEEVIALCKNMVKYWDQGLKIIKQMKPIYKNNLERIKDIEVAEALGIQFKSGLNILTFYALREKMLQGKDKNRLGLLYQMKKIVESELELDKKLLTLCKNNSTLGFHSETEGYKYFPAKIEWRMKQLKKLFKTDFIEIESCIKKNKLLFPEYTGRKPKGIIYHCKKLQKAPVMNGKPCKGIWDELDEADCKEKVACSHFRKTTWKAGYTDDSLYFGVVCNEPDMKNVRDYFQDKKMISFWDNDCVDISIEPKRLWPAIHFIANAKGSRWSVKIGTQGDYNWKTYAYRWESGWSLIIKIPFKCLGGVSLRGVPQAGRRSNLGNKEIATLPLVARNDKMGLSDIILRINVSRLIPQKSKTDEKIIKYWIKPNPIKPRNVYGSENPADLGWLALDLTK